MDELAQLNAQWQESQIPHSVAPEGGGHQMVCPHCKKKGPVQQELFSAMSDALAHKQGCPPVE